MFTGRVVIQKDEQDTVFGFKFWSRQDDDNGEQVYNGHIGYLTNDTDRLYTLKSGKNALESLLYGGGGRLIARDFIKLDTSKAEVILINQDKKNYFLTLKYPDLVKYNVTNRKKVLTIDKSNMLPIAVREHQETLGKVQDLYYEVKEMTRTESGNYDFSSPSFLRDYTHSVTEKSKSSVYALKDSVAPSFDLETFSGAIVSSMGIKGKVTLLDFWEVWCGPCVESLPKVQQLYQSYKNKGLNIYGITNDLKQLSSAKLLVKKQALEFPMLVGNVKIRKNYKLNGTVPLYILIDKKGRIVLVSEGLPGNLEETIQRLL